MDYKTAKKDSVEVENTGIIFFQAFPFLLLYILFSVFKLISFIF